MALAKTSLLPMPALVHGSCWLTSDGLDRTSSPSLFLPTWLLHAIFPCRCHSSSPGSSTHAYHILQQCVLTPHCDDVLYQCVLTSHCDNVLQQCVLTSHYTFLAFLGKAEERQRWNNGREITQLHKGHHFLKTYSSSAYKITMLTINCLENKAVFQKESYPDHTTRLALQGICGGKHGRYCVCVCVCCFCVFVWDGLTE